VGVVNWNDLKFLLSVVDRGSLRMAALDLNVDPGEVTKRIGALETALNAQLVTRAGDAVTVTASGQRTVAVARTLAAQLKALADEVGGEHGQLAGTLCVTSTAGFVSRAMKAFDLLHENYPGLHVDVMVSSHVVDLRRKEADLAVRMFRDTQDGLAMHKLGTMGWSLYASDKYLAGHKPGANLLDGHRVIAFDASFSNTSGGRWLAANARDEDIGMRVGGIGQALDAALSHQGVCIVPCYLAKEQKVVRVTDQVLATNDVYAVYLAERSNEARLRIVIDALVDLFVRDQATFAGA
jgi:DNA-binding transcriptional LysR family regulator